MPLVNHPPTLRYRTVYSEITPINRIDFRIQRCNIAPMDNWDDYRFILALERSGTIRGAAQQLGVNHSTVSRRLATINTRYGGVIFEQATHGYQPTALGAEMAEAARQMEMINFAADRRQKATSQDLAGPITVSLPGVLGQYLLSDMLNRFSQDYPAIQLRVESSYRFADLDRAEADIVVRGVERPPDHLVGRRLLPYALNHYCSRDYLARTAPEERRWITGLPHTDPASWIAETPFPDAPVSWHTDDIMMRHVAALAGHGMIRAACYMADPEPGLVPLPGSKPAGGLPLWVLTHPDLRETPRIKLLMREIAAAILAQRDVIEGRSSGA